MKRSWIPIVVFVALLCWSFVDEDPHHQYSWTGKDYRVETTLLHGMYDGSYTSWYTNGQKRAAGEFKNNMRTGTWTVWDSTGKMRVQRAYKNSFEYTQIFPALPDGPAKLFGNPQCEWKYNAKGFIEYPYVWERAVMISKRVWREIPKEDWSPLFNDDRFWWIVRDAVMSDKVNLYADDEFRVKYVPPMLQPLNSDSAVTDSIVGYKIKEDWYYNSDLMREKRSSSVFARSQRIAAAAIISTKISDGFTFRSYAMSWRKRKFPRPACPITFTPSTTCSSSAISTATFTKSRTSTIAN